MHFFYKLTQIKQRKNNKFANNNARIIAIILSISTEQYYTSEEAEHSQKSFIRERMAWNEQIIATMVDKSCGKSPWSSKSQFDCFCYFSLFGDFFYCELFVCYFGLMNSKISIFGRVAIFLTWNWRIFWREKTGIAND